jgi:hypothetical protein
MLSVVLCTHAPRPDYLRRTFAALAAQDLPRSEWELVVVDNASPVPVTLPEDLDGMVVVEPELGLVAARRRGIAASTGDVIVFVDDDNVLAPTYLSVAAAVARDFPLLGVWGGQQVPEWEVPPTADLERYTSMLGLRTLDGDRWSLVPFDWNTAPFGAGLCVRREAAERWVEALGRDTARAALGVRGAGLARGEDLDIVFTTVAGGQGSGLFAGLSLTHLMPAGRSAFAHLRQLAWNNGFSGVALERIHGVPGGRPRGRAELLRLVSVLGEPTLSGMRLKLADWRGRQAALAS